MYELALALPKHGEPVDIFRAAAPVKYGESGVVSKLGRANWRGQP